MYANFDNFIKIKVTIGKWSGKKMILGELLGISEEKLPPDLAKVVVTLVDSKIHNQFTRLYQKSRGLLKDWGYTFDGENFIPKTLLKQIEDQLIKNKEEYEEAIKQLKEILPKEKQAIKEKHIKLWPKIEPLYPSNTEIMNRFYFTWKVRGALVAAPEGVADAGKRFAELKQDIDEFFFNLGKAIRVETQKVFSNMQTKLEKGVAFNTPTLRRLMDICNKITLVDILDQKELRKQAKIVKDLLKNVDIYELKKASSGYDKQLVGTVVKELRKMGTIVNNKNDLTLKKLALGYSRNIKFTKN